MKIWDVHCHPNAPGDSPEQSLDNMLRYADRVGIERMCIYMPHPWDKHAKPELFRRSNDVVLRMMKHRSDRVFGFAYINPKYLPESLAEIERCIANGPMVGVKLWQGLNCTAPEYDPVVSRVAELKAVFFHHTWYKDAEPNPDASTPEDLVKLSKRHPGVPLICGHTGGNWELGIRAIRGQVELSADLAGSEPVAGYVDMAVRELGADRVIYGSDAWGRSFSSQLSKVSAARISDAEKQMVYRDNLRRLMLPILKNKGIDA